MQIESASLAKHKFGQADFFFLCKTFQGLKYINDKSGAQEPEKKYIQYVFSTYLAKDGLSLTSYMEHRE